MIPQELLDIYVLSGFLGSGKTTLLRNLLRDPEFRDTAVIVNEFGEIGLDHDLLETSEDDVILLRGGCLCCTVREDLAATIWRLIERRTAGKTPPFRRIVIETTGVADPVPVLFTLRTDPRVRQFCGLKGLIVTVDAQNAIATLARNVESVRQAALADRIVITKTDLVARETTQAVRMAVAQLNPSASILTSSGGDLAPGSLLDDLGHDSTLGDSTLGEGDVKQWLGEAHPERERNDRFDFSRKSDHAARYHSISWVGSASIDWSSFGIWLTMLLHAHGERVLRVKGILDVKGAVGPVAIHGVQHMVHPPIHLRAWPQGPRVSRLVFVVSDMPEESIRESFEVFLRLADVAVGSPSDAVRPGGVGGIIGGRPVRRRMAPAWLKG
jgi:G3E family GTPase